MPHAQIPLPSPTGLRRPQRRGEWLRVPRTRRQRSAVVSRRATVSSRSMLFLRDLGRRIALESGEPRSTDYLLQRLCKHCHILAEPSILRCPTRGGTTRACARITADCSIFVHRQGHLPKLEAQVEILQHERHSGMFISAYSAPSLESPLSIQAIISLFHISYLKNANFNTVFALITGILQLEEFAMCQCVWITSTNQIIAKYQFCSG